MTRRRIPGLPILAGGDGLDDDSTDDDVETDETDDSTDDEDEGGDDSGDDEHDDRTGELPNDVAKLKAIIKQKDARNGKASRESAKYRTQRNTERTAHEATKAERDSLRIELAFNRSVGTTFVDADAAFKLLDRELLTIGDDGSITGLDEAIAALGETHPFLLAVDDKPDRPEVDPFVTRSGRAMGGKRPTNATVDRAALNKKYPALRRR